MNTKQVRHMRAGFGALMSATFVVAMVACSDDTAVNGTTPPIGSTAQDAKTDAKTGATPDAKSGDGSATGVDGGGGALGDSGGSGAADSGGGGGGGVVDSGGGGGGVPVTQCSNAGYVCRPGDFTDPCAAAGGFAINIYSCGAGYPGSCCTK